jgi:hypothetical protein
MLPASPARVCRRRIRPRPNDGILSEASIQLPNHGEACARRRLLQLDLQVAPAVELEDWEERNKGRLFAKAWAVPAFVASMDCSCSSCKGGF